MKDLINSSPDYNPSASSSFETFGDGSKPPSTGKLSFPATDEFRQPQVWLRKESDAS